MSKKTIRLISTIVTFAVIMLLATSVFALSPSEITGANATTNDTQIKSIGNNIVSVLRSVGVVISVVILIVIGIKYMMGSASEKAEYKKTMMPYLVGAILIFAASALAGVVFEFANNIK